jgi:hypothetical protein
MATQAEVKAKLDALTAEVADENTVIGGLTTLVDNLSGQLNTLKANAANADIPQALMDEIDGLSTAVATGKSAIVKAVTDNTPAAP